MASFRFVDNLYTLCLLLYEVRKNRMLHLAHKMRHGLAKVVSKGFKGKKVSWMWDLIYLLPLVIFVLLMKPLGDELRAVEREMDRHYCENGDDCLNRTLRDQGATSFVEIGSSMFKMTKWLTLVCCATSLILAGGEARFVETASLAKSQNMFCQLLAQLPQKTVLSVPKYCDGQQKTKEG
jgi:hypothetical protein